MTTGRKWRGSGQWVLARDLNSSRTLGSDGLGL